MEDKGHNEPTDVVSEQNDGAAADRQLPICCQLDSKFPGMFRVKRAKGKVFNSGGFGVAISVEGPDLSTTIEGMEVPNQESNSEVAHETNGDTKDSKDAKAPWKASFDYLFLEEVIFLYEQGLLECESGDINDESDSNGDTLAPQTLGASDLYAMLKTFQLPMASYLVFAHLRQQTFRVRRYTTNCLALIQQIEKCSNAREKRNLQLQLRQDVQQAPASTVIHQDSEPRFAFCVYNPDCNFSKSRPGIPDFLVAVTHFGQPALDYETLQNLMALANGIPIKLATVADSGTVIMFGITDYGVPPLETPAKANGNTTN